MKIEINKDAYIDIYPHSLEIGQGFKTPKGIYIIKVSNGYMEIDGDDIIFLSEKYFDEEDFMDGTLVENEEIVLKF